MEPNATLHVTANELGRVLHNACLFVLKDATRPVLNHVRVTFAQDAESQTARITATATDSYFMAEDHCHAEDGAAIVRQTFILHRESLAPVVKMLLAKSSYPRRTVLTLTEHTITVQVDATTHTLAHYADCEYPNTEQLWPTDEPNLNGTGIGLDPKRLAVFSKIVRHAKPSARDPQGCRFIFYGDTKPCLVTSMEHGSSFRALVMPVRT